MVTDVTSRHHIPSSRSPEGSLYYYVQLTLKEVEYHCQPKDLVDNTYANVYCLGEEGDFDPQNIYVCDGVISCTATECLQLDSSQCPDQTDIWTVKASGKATKMTLTQICVPYVVEDERVGCVSAGITSAPDTVPSGTYTSVLVPLLLSMLSSSFLT